MAKQYWVGEFYVDLSRNQISQLGQSQTLPPKALQVLTYLAKHKGQVVSYDELLDEVWPNAVVTPNSLQRSITQLRKVLEADGNTQNVIKTHAKQGYSLECDVNWHGAQKEQQEQNHIDPPTVFEEAKTEPSPATFIENKPARKQSLGLNYWIGIGVLLCVVSAIVFQQGSSSPAALIFSEVSYLTATDDKEYGALYSHDGLHIVFQRYYDKVCMNNIWAKDTSTLQEVRLTAERGTYSGQSLSPDGTTLTFIKEQNCLKPTTQNTCYHLMSIDFQAGLSAPQTPATLLECQHTAIEKPIWLNNDELAMLKRPERQWQLIRYSVSQNASEPLYTIESGTIIDYVVNHQRSEIAVYSLLENGEQIIDFINPSGALLARYPFVLPEGVPRQIKIHMAFSPDTDNLYLAAGGALYQMNPSGNITAVDVPVDTYISSPSFHPDGSQLLLIKGRYDSDIAEFSPSEQMHISARSIETDSDAKYYPNDNSYAYISSQTGTEQIWLNREGNKQLISQLPKGSYISHFLWSDDGEQLLLVSNMTLIKLNLSGEQTRIPFPLKIFGAYAWDAVNQTALVTVFEKGRSQLAHVDLNTQTYSIVTTKSVRFAAQSQTGLLVFMDNESQIWIKGAIEDELIAPLRNQGSDKGFILRGDILWGINKDNQLWSYSLSTSEFNTVATLPADIKALTDKSNDTFLLTQLIGERKEIIAVSVTQ